MTVNNNGAIQYNIEQLRYLPSYKIYLVNVDNHYRSNVFCCFLFLFLWLSSTLVEEKPLCFTAVLHSSPSFQKVISEVTERIPFILSHNIRSGCNLIMHPKS